jgi:hypothetical protein
MSLEIPYARIRRIVGNMPIHRSESDIRADIRFRCDPDIWPPDLILKAEDYAVKVYKRMTKKREVKP